MTDKKRKCKRRSKWDIKKISYDQIKASSEKKSAPVKGKAKRLIYDYTPNFKDSFRVISVGPKIHFNLMRQSDKRIYFNNDTALDEKKQMVMQTLTIEVQEVEGVVEGKVVKAYFKKPIQDTLVGETLMILAQEIPYISRKKMVHSFASLTENSYLVLEWFVKGIDYEPLKNVIPRINSYEQLCLVRDWRDCSMIYSLEEEQILFCNDIHVIEDCPAFNIILLGAPDILKTEQLRVREMVFGEKIFDGISSTVKGAIPSFHDGVKPGAILESKFIFLYDEFTKQVVKANALHQSLPQGIYNIMESLVSVISRTRNTIGSGNGSINAFFRNAILFSDNLLSNKETFRKVRDIDSSVMRRYSPLLIGYETTTKAKAVPRGYEKRKEKILEYLHRTFGGKGNYELLFRFARSSIPKVQFDETKFKKELTIGPRTDLLPAFIKSVCVWRTIFEHNDNSTLPFQFIANDADYLLAEKLTRRLLSDYDDMISG